uniref:SecY-independent transporter protein n=1 Tax=Cutleria multifida TaxID=74475 RepID=UPI002E7A28C4|nr:SecY-independent transporter protein [Cutleria multifida]WBP69874.1 SecY-independent transporter protein [Cutleria multifida]
MKKFQLSLYYIQEFNYRIGYTILGTVFAFSTTYKYKQSLIFIFLPKGLSHFVTTGLTELFTTYLQLCTIISIGIGIGISLAQLFFFFTPGLYHYEAKTFRRLIIIIICFYSCLYIYIFPILIEILWRLFTAYSQEFEAINLTFEPRLNDFLDHIKKLNKILALIFPCMIILNLAQKQTSKKFWVSFRGLAYIIAFTLSAIITPPDILSQTVVGLPIIIIYESQLLYWSIHEEYKYQLGNQSKPKRIPTERKKKAKASGKKHFQPSFIS